MRANMGEGRGNLVGQFARACYRRLSRGIQRDDSDHFRRRVELNFASACAYHLINFRSQIGGQFVAAVCRPFGGVDAQGHRVR